MKNWKRKKKNEKIESKKYFFLRLKFLAIFFLVGKNGFFPFSKEWFCSQRAWEWSDKKNFEEKASQEKEKTVFFTWTKSVAEIQTKTFFSAISFIFLFSFSISCFSCVCKITLLRHEYFNLPTSVVRSKNLKKMTKLALTRGFHLRLSFVLEYM